RRVVRSATAAPGEGVFSQPTKKSTAHRVATCHASRKSPIGEARSAGRRQPATRAEAAARDRAAGAPTSVAIYLVAPSFFASSSERTLPPCLVAKASASSFQAKATSEADMALPLPPAT